VTWSRSTESLRLTDQTCPYILTGKTCYTACHRWCDLHAAPQKEVPHTCSPTRMERRNLLEGVSLLQFLWPPNQFCIECAIILQSAGVHLRDPTKRIEACLLKINEQRRLSSIPSHGAAGHPEGCPCSVTCENHQTDSARTSPSVHLCVTQQATPVWRKITITIIAQG
jgi:hypothetical protein